MNPGPLVFLAAFFAMAVSWLGFVVTPQIQNGGQDQVEAKDTSQLYPTRRPGLANQGAEVYRANGCYYCHSQQVRSDWARASADKLRWGARKSRVQSIAQDYLYDEPVMLGSQRVGPDLTNIGVRQTNEMGLLIHLYDPQATAPGSIMPPYRFLFRPLKPREKLPPDALPPGTGGAKEQLVPTEDARALVAYLLSLHAEALIYPTTPPWPTNAPATNAVEGAPATNAPAPAATNTPAK